MEPGQRFVPYLEIKQKIPIGAIVISAESIFKTSSFIPLKKLIKFLLSFRFDKHPPRMREKKITCNILPSLRDLKGFSGMISSNTSKKEGASLIFN